MKIIYSEAHRAHDGGMEFVNGGFVPMYEKPARMDMVLARIEATGFGEMVEPTSFDLSAAKRVHDPGYLTFLEQAYGLYRAETEGEAELDFALPFAFGMRGMRQNPGESIYAKLGCYCFDLSVPFVEGTWSAIKTSCDIALTGAALMRGGAPAVFSLCRPPGHHASSDLAGGYCYINNVAVAAQAALDFGAERVAILDVDYHHGNGTQAIFYDRDDLLFVSLHGHPDQEYPYFAGYAEETGAAQGEGYNLNLPMRWGTAWSDYGAALETAVASLRDYGPDLLLVSLGVDTYKADPISKFKLEHEDYLRIGRAIVGLHLPTQFVMEGGYAVEEIGVNVVNTLIGFEEAA